MDKKIRANRIRHKLKRLANETRVVGEHRLRMSVHKSDKHIGVQIIDDLKGSGETLVSASTQDKGVRGKVKTGSNMGAAEEVGKAIAERAKKAGIEYVYFDRGPNRFTGRVKALADAARAGGLKF